MKIDAAQLESHLQNSLLPLYFISGDETLLVQESLAAIRKKAREQGFTERDSYQIETRFAWQDVLLNANSLSLFAEKKIIELHFRQGKFLAADSDAVTELITNSNADTLIIITMPRLESGVNKSKLFKTLDTQGGTITIWPIERSKLSPWIAGRLQRFKLQVERDAIEYLADNTEGNLLATQQEIEKLYLVSDGQRVTLETMMQSISNASRYTVFNYVDRCLQGDSTHALRTLYGLRDEGQDAILLLNAIARELRTVYRLQIAQQQGTPLTQAYNQERIFPMRQALYGQAVKRLNLAKIQQALLMAQQIDQSLKGLSKASPWLLFEQLTLLLC